LLAERAETGRPITVALIGAGKFGRMFLVQARRVRGIHVAAIVDKDYDQACNALALAGWPAPAYAAPDLPVALATGATFVTEEVDPILTGEGIDLVIEATGDAESGLVHALACLENGKHLIMVTIEADVLAGPLLAQRFRRAGLIYSLAYGDQPALIAEMVDWARLNGFDIACVGRGSKYHPDFRYATPETVWENYGIDEDRAVRGGLNPQIFNSYIDGSKPANEMACVANACALWPQPEGLSYPACGTDDLPHLMRPRWSGGLLTHRRTLEVVSSIERDGRPVFRDLRWGVFIVVEADAEYAQRCFDDYGMVTDRTGRFAAMYKPFHLIGMELGVSVASIGLLRRPTGQPDGFRADVVAAAKRDLAVGERLDGEGGYTVYGRLMPAVASRARDALPLALARRVALTRAIKRDELVRWSDVTIDETAISVIMRREMQETMSPSPAID
jgi:predicted homoserine dehydrogenase-like protein